MSAVAPDRSRCVTTLRASDPPMHKSRAGRLSLAPLGGFLRRGGGRNRTLSIATATAPRLPIAVGTFAPIAACCRCGVIDGVRRNSAGDPELRLGPGAERQDGQAGEKRPDPSSLRALLSKSHPAQIPRPARLQLCSDRYHGRCPSHDGAIICRLRVNRNSDPQRTTSSMPQVGLFFAAPRHDSKTAHIF
jgi:hypothetical protein